LLYKELRDSLLATGGTELQEANDKVIHHYYTAYSIHIDASAIVYACMLIIATVAAANTAVVVLLLQLNIVGLR
jgi:hypothetical protein